MKLEKMLKLTLEIINSFVVKRLEFIFSNLFKLLKTAHILTF